MIFMKLTVSHKANCCGDLSPRRVAATYRLVCPDLNYPTGTNKRFLPTTPNHVLPLLSTLDKSKAAGLDDISARLIRDCADLICSPLCVIFNQSRRLGTFADGWKSARVTPLFKQGEQNDLNNSVPPHFRYLGSSQST